MHNRFGRSNSTLTPEPPVARELGSRGVRGRETSPKRAPIRSPPIRNPRNPWQLAREKPRQL
eukprot:10520919-Alexandrium_andersonii.AAC.1